MTYVQFPDPSILIDHGLYLYFTVFFYLCPPLTGAPGKIAPPPLWAALTAPAVATIYDSVYSFIIACLQERNIFVLASERRLRRAKPLEEFQGQYICPTQSHRTFSQTVL
jgi:hypothetical protein